MEDFDEKPFLMNSIVNDDEPVQKLAHPGLLSDDTACAREARQQIHMV